MRHLCHRDLQVADLKTRASTHSMSLNQPTKTSTPSQPKRSTLQISVDVLFCSAPKINPLLQLLYLNFKCNNKGLYHHFKAAFHVKITPSAVVRFVTQPDVGLLQTTAGFHELHRQPA